MIFIGIDPGLTGAVAMVNPQGDCQVEDIPTVTLPGNGLVKRRVDGLALGRLLRRFIPAGEVATVLVEQVRAMGGQNNAVQTQFSLGRTLGAIEVTLDLLRLQADMIEPQRWKKFYGLGSDKAESLRLARQLYEHAPLKLAKHHNRAEALLIAHCGMRTLA